jgi:hypothetical protein
MLPPEHKSQPIRPGEGALANVSSSKGFARPNEAPGKCTSSQHNCCANLFALCYDGRQNGWRIVFRLCVSPIMQTVLHLQD